MKPFDEMNNSEKTGATLALLFFFHKPILFVFAILLAFAVTGGAVFLTWAILLYPITLIKIIEENWTHQIIYAVTVICVFGVAFPVASAAYVAHKGMSALAFCIFASIFFGAGPILALIGIFAVQNKSKPFSTKAKYQDKTELFLQVPPKVALILSPLIGSILGYTASIAGDNQFGQLLFSITPIVTGWLIGQSSQSRKQGIVLGIIGGLLSTFHAVGVIAIRLNLIELFQQLETFVKVMCVVALLLHSIVLGGFIGGISVRRGIL